MQHRDGHSDSEEDRVGVQEHRLDQILILVSLGSHGLLLLHRCLPLNDHQPLELALAANMQLQRKFGNRLVDQHHLLLGQPKFVDMHDRQVELDTPLRDEPEVLKDGRRNAPCRPRRDLLNNVQVKLRLPHWDEVVHALLCHVEHCVVFVDRLVLLRQFPRNQVDRLLGFRALFPVDERADTMDHIRCSQRHHRIRAVPRGEHVEEDRLVVPRVRDVCARQVHLQVPRVGRQGGVQLQSFLVEDERPLPLDIERVGQARGARRCGRWDHAVVRHHHAPRGLVRPCQVHVDLEFGSDGPERRDPPGSSHRMSLRQGLPRGVSSTQGG
mmetsp:Transcript_67426/g.160888  ORF Transcript_67426/g.160888 Transcript_67426/m.160888 type:complete len:326 (-) Transcript_67426:291-1268(-)